MQFLTSNHPPSRLGEWCEAVLRGGLCVLLLMALGSTAQAQSLDLDVEVQEPEDIHFIWAEDEWTGQDKFDHALGGFGLMAGSSLIFKPNSHHDVWRTAGYSTLFWVVWEIKDGLIPWRHFGYWGGDGASARDAVWSAAGVGVATALVFLVR